MNYCLRLIAFSVLLSLSCLHLESKEAVYTVETKESVTASGSVPPFSSAAFRSTYTGSDRYHAGNSMTLTLRGFAGRTLRSLRLVMKSNTGSGSGSMSIACGSDTLAKIDNSSFRDAVWNGAFTASYTDKTIAMDDYPVGTDDVLTVVIKASANSLYCRSFAIEYEDVPTAVSPPAVGIRDGIYFGEQTFTISPPGDGTALGVYYTLDGSDPRISGGSRAEITESRTLTLDSASEIWAVAYDSEGRCSAFSSARVDIVIPDRSYSAALAAPLGSRYYALSAGEGSGLTAVPVYAANGRIVNATDSQRDSLTWHIYESGGRAYIRSSGGLFLAGGTSTSLRLDSLMFGWTSDSATGSWSHSSRSFICRNNSGTVTFSNYSVANVGANSFQSDYTKPYTFADGYVRTGTVAYRLGTICLPCDVSENDCSGVQFFEISGVVKKSRDMSVDDVTGIALTPVRSLKAGVPYIFQATSTSNSIAVAYSGGRVAEARRGMGLVGNMSNEAVTIGEGDATHWHYVLLDNRLCRLSAGGKAVISPNRAYIDLFGVPEFNMGSASSKTDIQCTGHAPAGTRSQKRTVHIFRQEIPCKKQAEIE